MTENGDQGESDSLEAAGLCCYLEERTIHTGVSQGQSVERHLKDHPRRNFPERTRTAESASE